MPVTQQKFDQFKVDKLKHYLEDMAEKEQPRLYEIFVDSLKVVPKTDDISQFDTYEQYMDEDTEKIRILVYNSPLSPRNDQFCFLVQPGRPEKAAPGGLGEIDTIVQEKLAARDREHEMEALSKELDMARAQVEEVEEEAEGLRQELEAVKAGRERKQIKGIEVVSILLEGFMRRNPQLLQKIPGGEALAGLIEQDNLEKTGQLPAEPAVEATFRKQPEAAPALAPEQLRYIDTLRQLETTFQQPDLETVMQVLARFADNPDTLKTVAELLNTKNP
jgi:hypothetical protein